MENTVTKLVGREVVSCLLAVSEPEARGTGVSGRPGSLGARDVRPIRALLVAGQAQAAVAYAAVATSADLQKQKQVNRRVFGNGIATATTAQHMWALRGPEPWKEPS
jgi:hypothetical protein